MHAISEVVLDFDWRPYIIQSVYAARLVSQKKIKIAYISNPIKRFGTPVGWTQTINTRLNKLNTLVSTKQENMFTTWGEIGLYTCIHENGRLRMTSWRQEHIADVIQEVTLDTRSHSHHIHSYTPKNTISLPECTITVSAWHRLGTRVPCNEGFLI